MYHICGFLLTKLLSRVVGLCSAGVGLTYIVNVTI